MKGYEVNGIILGLHWDNGKENENCRDYRGYIGYAAGVHLDDLLQSGLLYKLSHKQISTSLEKMSVHPKSGDKAGTPQIGTLDCCSNQRLQLRHTNFALRGCDRLRIVPESWDAEWFRAWGLGFQTNRNCIRNEKVPEVSEWRVCSVSLNAPMLGTRL